MLDEQGVRIYHEQYKKHDKDFYENKFNSITDHRAGNRVTNIVL